MIRPIHNFTNVRTHFYQAVSSQVEALGMTPICLGSLAEVSASRFADVEELHCPFGGGAALVQAEELQDDSQHYLQIYSSGDAEHVILYYAQGNRCGREQNRLHLKWARVNNSGASALMMIVMMAN